MIGRLNNFAQSDDGSKRPPSKPNRHERRAKASQDRKRNKKAAGWAGKKLGDACKHYVDDARRWQVARDAAGGRLSDEEEARWHGVLDGWWTLMSDEERHAVETLLPTEEP